jgi:hypothetical protein
MAHTYVVKRKQKMSDQAINTLEGLAAALVDAEDGQVNETPEDAQPGDVEQTDDVTPADVDSDAENADEDPDAAAEDDGQATAPTDDAVIKWSTPNGEVEASIAELKDGYLRHADYTQKTQTLAEERRQVEVELSKKFEEAQQMTRERARLFVLESQLDQFQRADWNALYQQDPVEAGRLQAEWNQLKYEAQTLIGNVTQHNQQREQERMKALQQATQAALETLQRDIPNFSPAVITAARETAIAHGYTDAELAGITDPRALKVLHEAAQWRALQAKKPAVQNKVQAAPPKATKPAGAARAPATKQEAAWNQMKAKRDVNSFAAYLAAQE